MELKTFDIINKNWFVIKKIIELKSLWENINKFNNDAFGTGRLIWTLWARAKVILLTNWKH